ncbi:peptidoglycan-binding protein [Streptomyces sp. NPDC058964]|uniref:peptidoglycan-binding protein n=1 Tax=Streptomyces sp. NPDC058964 TaxID=3346681 RepID=UPI0036C81BBD
MFGNRSTSGHRVAPRPRTTVRRAATSSAAVCVLAAAGVAALPAAQASAATSALCSTTLSQGASGSCVSALQTRLDQLGAHLTVDGSFGPATRNAVEAFQGRADLAVDGVVGPATQSRLSNPGSVNLNTRSAAQIEAMIRQTFPDNLEAKAIRVARCESGLNEIAVGRNNNGSRDFGVFQFNNGGTLESYLGTTSRALDAPQNIAAAYRLYQARGWQPWTCRNA